MSGLWITERPPAQTVPGGEAMDQREFVIGSVTYEVRRMYGGERSRQELIQERVARAQMEQAAFDLTASMRYNIPSGSVRRRGEA